MKILLIGGNGYIGSALYEYFKLNGYNVQSIDLCLFGIDAGYSIKQNYITFDISNYSHIILLAAHSSVAMCEFNQKNAWLNNVTYFFNLCQQLEFNQTLIYASSASVYGTLPGISKESRINLFPINTYDLTKISNDIIANSFIKRGKNIVGLRFGTVNGPSKNIRSDLMINSMFKSYMECGEIFIKNINIHRPILSIKDLVRAIGAILNSKNIVSGQYNLTSFNTTVYNIAEVLNKLLKCKINIDENNDNNIYDFMIDNTLFQTTYNYIFKETIEDIILDFNMLSDCTNFFPRNNDNLFNSNIQEL